MTVKYHASVIIDYYLQCVVIFKRTFVNVFCNNNIIPIDISEKVDVSTQATENILSLKKSILRKRLKYV